ncbi:cell envelope biogenesis protein AsmA [Azorhizobium oxalatiphilum]|uniref:Cell envelope biogenesis protein AsmA n=1 Tax=Azorhizobium oxalatiphilum TaxID=980631 RepID=A0A917BW66_9HYPH|nr:AsmA family protein [Azorhizobium oxalatiphilum]GGF59841.1 cell envelope biogenesis protein AsmA [Azorhizobium oxalatiphilum]
MVTLGPSARRLALVTAASAGAIAGLLLLALAVAPALVPQAEVRRAASDALAASSGRDVTVLGESRFSLLPAPRIVLDRIQLSMPGTAALESERLTARLSLLPLLMGRAEVASVTLERPILTMSGPVTVPHLSLAPFVSGTSNATLKVENGTIAWRDQNGLTQELVSAIDARLERSGGGRGISASADFSWRDHVVSGRMIVGNARHFLDGVDSDTKLDVSVAGSWLKFRGTSAAGPNPVAEGEITLDSPDLRDLLGWVGQPVATSGGFGRFAFGAHLSAHARQIALTPAYIEMDGNRSEGGLTMKLDGERPLVEGTFAADALNITPYGRVSLTAGGGHEWDHSRLDVSPLRKVDLDLRLSANSIRADESLFERVAGTAVLRGGRLDMSIGEARAWGGLLRATMMLAPSETARGSLALRLDMEASNVALDRALGDMADVRRLEGTGSIQASLTGHGSSIYGLAHSLSGDISLSGKAGAIVGLDVAQALRHIEQRPLSGGGDLRGGRTAFNTLEAKAHIENGQATIEGARIEGKLVKLTLNGAVSVVHRDLDLKGEASLLSSAAATAFDLPFIVQGPWDNAYVMPDAQSLIRRSGAAAPLLEAVRSRGGDAAVRTMIEQIAKPSPLLPTAGKTAN